MITTLLVIFAVAAIVGFVIGAIVIGLASVLEALWFVTKLVLVSVPIFISFVLARLLFGF